MEEFLVIFIQIFFEFGLQLFGSAAVDGISKNNKGCGILSLHMLLGGGLGWLSTLIWPNLLLPHPGLQIANLVFAPLMAGAISTWIICTWQKRESHSSAFYHGALFAFMFGIARYGFANH